MEFHKECINNKKTLKNSKMRLPLNFLKIISSISIVAINYALLT